MRHDASAWNQGEMFQMKVRAAASASAPPASACIMFMRSYAISVEASILRLIRVYIIIPSSPKKFGVFPFLLIVLILILPPCIWIRRDNFG